MILYNHKLQEHDPNNEIEGAYRLAEVQFENIFAVLEGGYHDRLMECINNFVSGVNTHKIR